MATVIITINADPFDSAAFMEDVELGVNRIVGSLGFTASNVEATVQELDFPGATSYEIEVPSRRASYDDWEE